MSIFTRSITASALVMLSSAAYSVEPLEQSVETQTYPLSCKAILDSGNSGGDGYYTIDPDGVGTDAPFDAYCDMTTDGGGWTEIIADSQTTLQDLSLFGDTDDIAMTYYSDVNFGIGWGSNNQVRHYLEIEDLAFTETQVEFSGYYNNPVEGLGAMYLTDIPLPRVWEPAAHNATVFFAFSDSHSLADKGQTLKVNGVALFSRAMINVFSRTETVQGYSPVITMAGYSPVTDYTRRYVSHMMVR